MPHMATRRSSPRSKGQARTLTVTHRTNAMTVTWMKLPALWAYVRAGETTNADDEPDPVSTSRAPRDRPGPTLGHVTLCCVSTVISRTRLIVGELKSKVKV
jgi:hypothetical protein